VFATYTFVARHALLLIQAAPKAEIWTLEEPEEKRPSTAIEAQPEVRLQQQRKQHLEQEVVSEKKARADKLLKKKLKQKGTADLVSQMCSLVLLLLFRPLTRVRSLDPGVTNLQALCALLEVYAATDAAVSAVC
jgi:hypothetical protein